eukprot:12231281-Prorocentrum_lima.AAC.1
MLFQSFWIFHRGLVWIPSAVVGTWKLVIHANSVFPCSSSAISGPPWCSGPWAGSLKLFFTS